MVVGAGAAGLTADPITRDRLATLTNMFVGRGEIPALAERHAIALLDGQVTRQALMLSFERL